MPSILRGSTVAVPIYTWSISTWMYCLGPFISSRNSPLRFSRSMLVHHEEDKSLRISATWSSLLLPAFPCCLTASSWSLCYVFLLSTLNCPKSIWFLLPFRLLRVVGSLAQRLLIVSLQDEHHQRLLLEILYSSWAFLHLSHLRGVAIELRNIPLVLSAIKWLRMYHCWQDKCGLWEYPATRESSKH